MELRITVHRARLGSREFRVLRPERPIHGVTLRDTGDWHLLLCTDSGEALRIATLWQLAARSRRSLVHIPLRSDPQALVDSWKWWPATPEGVGPSLLEDIVLAQHSLQLSPSRWPEIRRRLDRGRPQVVRSGLNMLAEFARQSGSRWRPAEDHDVLDLVAHGDTVFVTGSGSALHAGAYPFMEIGIHGPAVVRRDTAPGYCSASLHPLDGLLRHRSGKGIYLLYHSPWLERHRAAPSHGPTGREA